MGLIEIHPQLKETNLLLNRIATVLERWLLIEHGIALGSAAQPAVDPNPKDKPSVTYHTDEDTLREEMKTLAGWTERGDGEEDEIEEEERFGI